MSFRKLAKRFLIFQKVCVHVTSIGKPDEMTFEQLVEYILTGRQFDAGG